MNQAKRKAKRKQKGKQLRRVAGAFSGTAAADKEEDSWAAYYDRLEEEVKGKNCVICDGTISGAPYSIFEGGISTPDKDLNADFAEKMSVVAVCSSRCREEWLRRVRTGYYLFPDVANKNDVR